MSEHTKGPWAVHYCETLEIHPANDEHGERVIAEIPRDSVHGRWADEANAWLIAVAPEMLQLLDEFRHHLVNHPLGDGLRDTFERTCRIVEELKK